MGLLRATGAIIFGLIMAIGASLTLPYPAFGAAHSFGRSGNFWPPRMRPQHSFFHPFNRFGFFGADGVDEQQVIIIQQFQSAAATEAREPATKRIYVPPRWVDGGYGVEVLEPGYWTDPK